MTPISIASTPKRLRAVCSTPNSIDVRCRCWAMSTRLLTICSGAIVRLISIHPRMFSSAEYEVVNADAQSAGMNPLVHWLEYGRPAGRPMSISEREAQRGRTARFPIGLSLPEQIQLEAMKGIAYLSRYGFTLDKTSSLEHAAQAIGDLAARKPKLNTASTTPDVSIIIPVYGQLQILLNCLDLLANQESRYRVEILVVDDASPADTRLEEIAAVPWIRYLRQERNKGFVGACNRGAAAAAGKYLIFLNNDTRVLPGWLDELIGAFQLFPKAGLVGSKLVNDDGSLQEAGGIVWRDGAVWNYGRGELPERPEFCYARRVDYCSGAAIAVLAEAWEQIGGFDFVYSPAYCEDLDFAFKLRREGYEVWLQPLSVVIHYEGRSHGRDVSAGIKAYQVRNLRTFFTRWHEFARRPRLGRGLSPRRSEPDQASEHSSIGRPNADARS